MYFSTRQDFIGTRYMYTRFIFMTSELAIRVSLILIRLILLLQISDIVDFIFIKHELVVLACLQF